MSVFGKIIGGLVGLGLLGPIGLIIGIIVGHLFDKQYTKPIPTNKVSQTKYIASLFSVLGYIAKADGQVSSREIDYATSVMNRLHLNADQREQAMKAFYAGKHKDFDLTAALTTARINVGKQKRLLYFFINAQVQMAYADGVVKDDLKPLLQRMASVLGIMPLSFAYYDTIFGWQQQQQHQQWQQYRSQGSGPSYSSTTSLNDAYTILGVGAKANDQEVKRTYRKLMSQYHPDKLMSKGLSESEMQAATEKVQKIKAAYEQVRRSRNF